MKTTTELSHWQGVPVADWCSRWRLPALLVFAEVGSTNDVIRAAGAAGAPAGTTAIADYQSRGRGRLGRVWQAPAGSALLCSILLRPEPGGAPDSAGALPLRVGLAVATAIDTLSGARTTLKWPNDVLLDRAKVAGILCEAAPSFVVVGVGINLRQEAADFAPELGSSATSLRLATSTDIGPALLAEAIIDQLRPLFSARHRLLDDCDLAAFAARDALHDRPVTVDGVPAGRAAGVDPRGALLVEQGGVRRAIHAGTVRSIP